MQLVPPTHVLHAIRSAEIWLDRFATFEAGLDILQALALLAVATPLHSFVMESVRIEKALKQKELLESLKLRRPTSKPRAKRL